MIRRITYRIIATVTVALLLAAGAGPAGAAEPKKPVPHDLPTIIANITTWITGLLIGVATLFLTIAGIRYLAAGGDPTEVEKAKTALKSALVGYALAVLAPILLTVVQGWISG